MTVSGKNGSCPRAEGSLPSLRSTLPGPHTTGQQTSRQHLLFLPAQHCHNLAGEFQSQAGKGVSLSVSEGTGVSLSLVCWGQSSRGAQEENTAQKRQCVLTRPAVWPEFLEKAEPQAGGVRRRSRPSCKRKCRLSQTASQPSQPHSKQFTL